MPRLPKDIAIGNDIFATGPFCPWTPKPEAEMIEICPSDCSCHAAGEAEGQKPADQEQGGPRQAKPAPRS